MYKLHWFLAPRCPLSSVCSLLPYGRRVGTLGIRSLSRGRHYHLRLALSLLEAFQVGNDAQSIQDDGIKKRIVVAARDNWANYFSRLFPVQGENGSDVQILGVSHRGLRLLKVVKAAAYALEHLKVLCSYSFADVLSVELKDSNSLEFSLKMEQLLLRSYKAPCIKAMVELFIQELRQDTNYVVALRSYVIDDKSFFSFKKGDLIQLLPM